MGNCTDPRTESMAVDLQTKSMSAVSEGYIDYLSTYSQNMISFGKPIQIDLSLEDDHFDRLFTALINEKEVSTRHATRNQIHLIREQFIPSVDRYFTPEFEITPKAYKSLAFPVTLDLMGKNEVPVFARFIDFEKTMYYIKSDFFDIDQVIGALKKVKGFVISSEPDSENFEKQHVAWDRFRRKPDIEYLDLSEVERIREYAMTHGVAPWYV